jgi:hypothetical protein
MRICGTKLNAVKKNLGYTYGCDECDHQAQLPR